MPIITEIMPTELILHNLHASASMPRMHNTIPDIPNILYIAQTIS
ncbi:hypothetical protein FBY20_2963 [Achromobacter sp. SLBN-14]|nr:hypothetical protein FBY20_2963 [Achromobacter sp. SLBN-14]